MIEGPRSWQAARPLSILLCFSGRVLSAMPRSTASIAVYAFRVGEFGMKVGEIIGPDLFEGWLEAPPR